MSGLRHYKVFVHLEPNAFHTLHRRAQTEQEYKS